MERRRLGRMLPLDGTKRARKLRAASSVVERIAWEELRGRRLGFKFRRQHAFDRYVLDFYCHEALLAVEFDGEQHDALQDAERDAKLIAAGIETYRIPNTEFLGIERGENRNWIADIVRICEERSGKIVESGGCLDFMSALS